MKLQLLGQLRPSTATPESLYSPKAAANRQPGQQAVLKRIYIANVSNQDRLYSIFFDNDGTTYDETTALAWNVKLLKNTAEVFDLDVSMADSSGNLAVKTDSANNLNFTLFGEL